MTKTPILQDPTGEYVRFICRNGCRRGQTVRGALLRSDRFVVQPSLGEAPKKYAGHLAVCPHWGYEAMDGYNSSAAKS